MPADRHTSTRHIRKSASSRQAGLPGRKASRQEVPLRHKQTEAPEKSTTPGPPTQGPSTNDPLVMAAALLDAVREEDAPSVSALSKNLAGLDRMELSNTLNTDARKKAFWINLYNAQAQWAMLQNPPGGSTVAWLWFFRKKRFAVAGETLSLDQVEHGFLRRSRIWWAAGYLRKPWTSALERRWRVDTLDPRIHFALNCAAASCPPIRHYDAADIDRQLNLATAAYLDAELEEDAANGVLLLPGIFKMFRGDFATAGMVHSASGGKGVAEPAWRALWGRLTGAPSASEAGILAFLNRHDRFRGQAEAWRLRFKPFDRTRTLRHYA